MVEASTGSAAPAAIPSPPFPAAPCHAGAVLVVEGEAEPLTFVEFTNAA
jgi:hypothetical protein